MPYVHGMSSRSELVTAVEAWQDAESDYHDLVEQHVVGWWGEVPPEGLIAPEPVTNDAIERLGELRAVADARFADYREALARLA